MGAEANVPISQERRERKARIKNPKVSNIKQHASNSLYSIGSTNRPAV